MEAQTQGVRRAQRPGMTLAQAGVGGSHFYDLTLVPLPGESPRGLFDRLQGALAEFKAVPALQFIFGSNASLEPFREIFNAADWPVTWVDGASVLDGGIAGVQMIAVSERRVERVRLSARAAATVFEDGAARHCLVGGLGYDYPGESRPAQTRKTLDDLRLTLEGSGFEFRDIVRTWFYLDHILEWYDEFNKERTAFYGGHIFRVGSLPASTGISAMNPWQTALSSAAWAVQPLEDGAEVAREIASPLQCPAPCYGSSFSRAVEMNLVGAKRVTLSGTASIELGGKTAHVGDITRQINLTMQVVEAILGSRGMSLQDTARAAAYFKKPEFQLAFDQWRREHGLPLEFCLPVHCDICRDDLLFEIELDAIQ